MLRVQIPVQLANKIGLRMIWHTGQHVFVRFQTLGLHALTLHPFAICSLPPTMHKDERCEVVLFITPKGGITKKLAEMAEESPGTAVPVLLDGPYGGLTVKTLAQFDRAVIFAGGEGAGFTLPIIEDILHRKDFEKRGPGRVTRIRVIIAIRSLEMRDWYLMEMQRLLYRYLSAEFLKVDIYITSSSLRHSIYNKAKKFDDWTIRANVSISSSLNIFEDRPKIAQIIEEVSVTPYETVGVVACGPAEMIHDVQVAVAEAQLQILRGRGTSEIYLHTESFEW
jgi:ferric-chelate reductase